jgi:signal transduction histidine kinase
VVQAEAGASVATDGRSVDGFDGIADSGRHALTELRHLLGVLRTDEPPRPVAPRPGVERLAELVEHVAGAGLEADLVVDGAARMLPTAVDLSVYRIVQEGLTNVIKHADAASVTVTLRYHDGGVAVVVQDDGSGRRADAEGGFGITGLRERVDLLHGILDAGPCVSGGYALRVELPAP